jgi:hypothetical protein
MQEVNKNEHLVSGYALVCVVARLTAVVLLFSVAFVGVSYYKLRNTSAGDSSPAHRNFQATYRHYEGYEQRVTRTTVCMLVKASKDITFSDSHPELGNVVHSFIHLMAQRRMRSLLCVLYQPTTSVISFCR